MIACKDAIMKSNSASALTWLATILLVVGGLIMSPAGSFLTYILAVIFAAISDGTHPAGKIQKGKADKNNPFFYFSGYLL